MKRIIIMGSAGSGKSTLARELSKKTGIRAIHLDKEYWKPGWVLTDEAGQIEKHHHISSEDTWIIEGNYTTTLEERGQRAHIAIYLDMPFHLCMYRVVRRYFKYRGKVRDDLCDGCIEKLDMEFIKYICYYHWKKKYIHKSQLDKSMNGKTIITLKSKSEVEELIRDWEKVTRLKASS